MGRQNTHKTRPHARRDPQRANAGEEKGREGHISEQSVKIVVEKAKNPRRINVDMPPDMMATLRMLANLARKHDFVPAERRRRRKAAKMNNPREAAGSCQETGAGGGGGEP
jgi:hypothetical protein